MSNSGRRAEKRHKPWLNQNTEVFPARFSRLPGISDSEGGGGQVVPVRDLRVAELDAANAQADLKLSVLEKSNRALLDEVVRLQSEVKHLSHLSDRTLSDERHGQQALETALRSATEVIGQLNGRVRRAEERLAEDKAVIGALTSQVKNAEITAISGQQELGNRQAQQGTRLQELKAELDDAIHSKQNLEKLAFQLNEEVKATRLRCDTQATEFSGAILELKKRARNLEEETRLGRVESKRKDAEIEQHSELLSSQLRSQVESRLTELRQFLVDIRSRHDEEMNTKRSLEQQFNQRVAELQAAITEQSRRREEAVHALETMQREREHAAEVERSKLQAKLADITEDITRKVLARDMKLREESQDKFGQLQMLMEAEQESRKREERALQEEFQQQFLSERSKVKDDLKTLQEEYKLEKKRTHEVVHKLEDAVNLLEQHIEENRKQQERLLTAEINSRKRYEKSIEEHVEDTNKRLNSANTAMKSNVDSLFEKMQEQTEKIQKQLKETVETQLAATTRQVQEMENRVTTVTTKMNTVQEKLEKKIDSAKEAQTSAANQNLNQLQDWKSNTEETMREQTVETKRLAEEVLLLVERGKTLKQELDGKFQAEALSRERDSEKLRLDVEKLMRDMAAQQANNKAADIDMLQASVRKLAESIQTVKTVLGMKIQSEQKLRESTLQNIQEQIDDLHKAMEGR